MSLIAQRVRRILTTVRSPHPLAVALAARMAGQTAANLNGSRGTVRYGDGAQLGGRKFSGYGASPQSFKGAGAVRPSGAIRAGQQTGLPGTQAPYSEASPLLQSIAAAQNPRTAPDTPRSKR